MKRERILVDVHEKMNEFAENLLDFDTFSRILGAQRITEELTKRTNADTVEEERMVLGEQFGQAQKVWRYAETGSPVKVILKV